MDRLCPTYLEHRQVRSKGSPDYMRLLGFWRRMVQRMMNGWFLTTGYTRAGVTTENPPECISVQLSSKTMELVYTRFSLRPTNTVVNPIMLWRWAIPKIEWKRSQGGNVSFLACDSRPVLDPTVCSPVVCKSKSKYLGGKDLKLHKASYMFHVWVFVMFFSRWLFGYNKKSQPHFSKNAHFKNLSEVNR